jgi:hypothetical protein
LVQQLPNPLKGKYGGYNLYNFKPFWCNCN